MIAMEEMSAQALRVLAIAMCPNVTAPKEEGLTFLGLTGMIDPARPEAKEAVRTFREAAVDTIMITGDHVDTAFAIAKQLGIGELTLTDIVKELEKPSRDPRDEMPKPILRSDVLSMEDLKPDMELKGTVRNVVDFGAFVDIGVHEDGLVHLSQLCNRYVKHPSEVVSVGDIVNVRVLSVDLKKKRIALTMKTK